MWVIENCVTNAYCSMHRYCLLKGVKIPWNHHDFIEKAAMAWLDPVNHWPGRMEKRRYNRTIKDPTNKRKYESTLSPGRCERFNNITLHPKTGKLAVRLNTNVGHVPEELTVEKGKQNTHVCQLHRWAFKEEDKTENCAIPPGARKGVMYCGTCRAKLCVKCWKIFHTKKHLVPEAATICTYV